VSTPTPPIPRRRGRPRNDDLAEIRLRNLRWLWKHSFEGVDVAAIAAAAGVTRGTVLAGLRAARGYRRRVEEAA